MLDRDVGTAAERTLFVNALRDVLGLEPIPWTGESADDDGDREPRLADDGCRHVQGDPLRY